MSLTCLSQVVLHNTTGSSDKLYVVQVQQDTGPAGTEYLAVGYYGRRGATLSRAEKYKGTSRTSADAAASRLEREKRKDGYLDYSGGSSIPGMPSGAPAFGGPATTSPAAAPAASAAPVGPVPMLAEDVRDEAHLEELILDPAWAFQKKFDGERVPTSVRRKAMQGFNRKGAARGLTSGAESLLKKLIARPDFADEREAQLDGELMGDDYVVYDALILRDNDVRQLPYYERYSMLEVLLADQPQLLAETAWSEDEKRAMLERARKEGWEGIIARHIDQNYVNGRTQWLLRFKLWATVTCRVLTANAKRSIQVALREADGSEEFAGNVTVPVNQDMPQPDDLVEVRYLYALDGGSLYQPTLLQIRNDKDEADYRSIVRKAPPEKRGEPAVAAEPAVSAEPALANDDDGI
jgi:predicted DNA-binding WGR domain protein